MTSTGQVSACHEGVSTPRGKLPHIAVVIGTRPEIVKLARVVRLLGTAARLLHSCQHSDTELSAAFLAEARLPAPETLRGVCGEPRHAQIGRMVEQLGERFAARPPAAVLVQGDTNTACAAAQAASCTGIPVAHVEAGLRSFDRAMPEELNRQVIGVLADTHYAPTRHAVANLRAEGIPASRILLTGNTIVEATRASLPRRAAAERIIAGFGAEPGQYVLATIHRPENTDDPRQLGIILDELGKLGLPAFLPLHPRTRAAVRRHGLTEALDRLRLLPPVDHRTFLGLARHAALIVSDSGGVQEECTVLKRPLLVVRNSTERPEAIAAGFAQLVRAGPAIGDTGRRLLADPSLAARLAGAPCPFGDGRASERIASHLRQFLPLPARAPGCSGATETATFRYGPTTTWKSGACRVTARPKSRGGHMLMRSALERATHRVVVRRRLPPPFRAARMYASSEGGLRYLGSRAAKVDPELLGLAAEFVGPGHTVWDIGANLGLFSIAAAVAAGPDGQVLAVEPDTVLVGLLRRSAAANPGHASVEVLPAAVADRDCVARFHVARRNRSTSHLAGYGTTQSGGVRLTQPVPVVTLDSLAAHFPAPDVLKIDVEEAEASVLAGGQELLAAARPVVICEVAARHSRLVHETLTGCGYTLYDGGEPPDRRLPTGYAPPNTLAVSRPLSPGPA
jgi:UDP-N-acetylglucosamine 2-epimerase (non-hydrolysing)